MNDNSSGCLVLAALILIHCVAIVFWQGPLGIMIILAAVVIMALLGSVAVTADSAVLGLLVYVIFSVIGCYAVFQAWGEPTGTIVLIIWFAALIGTLLE